MIDLANIEFYSTPDGDVMVKPLDGSVKVLKQNDSELIAAILQLINDRYPKAYSALCKFYSRSSMNNSYYTYMIVHRFCRCNFGSLDTLQLDIDQKGIFHLEQVACPLRNTADCKLCGVVCSPELDTRLRRQELNILELIASGYTNQQIADLFHISIFTVIRHRNNMRARLGLNNTAALVAYYNSIKSI
jgi:DNA-binding CsgD family transcriptional regulator